MMARLRLCWLMPRRRPGGDKVRLKEVVHLGSIGGAPLDGLTSGETVQISVGELLAASAALSDGDHRIAFNLSKLLSVNFPPAGIAAQTYKPVHFSLALQTNLLGLTTKIMLKLVDHLL